MMEAIFWVIENRENIINCFVSRKFFKLVFAIRHHFENSLSTVSQFKFMSCRGRKSVMIEIMLFHYLWPVLCWPITISRKPLASEI